MQTRFHLLHELWQRNDSSRQATNDIKSEIQKTVDSDIENPTKSIASEFKKEVDEVKKDFTDLEDSIRRDL